MGNSFSTTQTRSNGNWGQFASGRKRAKTDRNDLPAIYSSSPSIIQRKASCSCGGGCPSCQANSGSLKVSHPNDPAEIEADQIADNVMRMPASETATRGSFALPGIRNRTSATSIKRKCDACESEEEQETLQRKPLTMGGGTVSQSPVHVREAIGSGGQPLDRETRSFFEPRFGTELDHVRVHRSMSASRSAHSINARAYTVGADITFAKGEYRPDTPEGRHLLAHELAHVVQRDSGRFEHPVIHRQVLGTGCAAHQSEIEAAWAEGTRLATETIESLEHASTSLTYGSPVPRTIRTAIQNSFGDVGFEPGFTFIPELIRRYNSILGGFTSGKTIRCDPESVPSDRNECDWRSAFVVVGDRTNIFLCPAIFEPDVSVTSRGLTLLHEMAHSVLRIGHEGLAERTFPEAFFDCATPLGISFDDAKRNAFAFDLLANCLHGERPSALVEPESSTGTEGEQESSDARWSISASAGADVTPDAYRFASALSGRVSLRTGEYVVFNPVVGLNLLYLPSSELNPSHLVAAAADLGLRIQQPVEGFYFDVAAGGYGGFDVDPSRPTNVEPTWGLSGAAGLGWRFSHLELGAETRALIPEAEFDDTQILVFGRAAVRFP